MAGWRGPSAEPRVALRGGERWLPAFEVRKPGLDRLPARLRSGGVYLITGGMGFVGQHIAFALARAVGARLLLVSRHIEPKASARLVRALKDEGASDVATLAADVADVEALQLVVDEARRRWGALHGVVHAAGVTGAAERTSTTVCAITMAACEEQLRPKLLGVQALGRMLTELPLDFVLLTSSLAAVLGGPGFAAYAAANAYMDSFAHTRCAQDGTTQWLSVNWDAWATSADKTAAAAFGSELARFALTPKEGRAALLGALALPRASQVLVSTGDLNARYAKWVRNALAQPGNNGESQPSTLQPRPSLSRTYAAPTNEVEETIAQIWCELLGFDRIGIHDQFAELGGHSLLATQVVSRVRNVLGVELPISDFLERPTVAGLSLVVLERLSEGVAEGEMALMLTQLETLDEDKAEQRLLAVGELSHVSVERTGRGAG